MPWTTNRCARSSPIWVRRLCVTAIVHSVHDAIAIVTPAASKPVTRTDHFCTFMPAVLVCKINRPLSSRTEDTSTLPADEAVDASNHSVRSPLVMLTLWTTVSSSMRSRVIPVPEAMFCKVIAWVKKEQRRDNSGGSRDNSSRR